MVQGISTTEFDMLGLGWMGSTEPDFIRCDMCNSQGCLTQQGKPAYANDHYGIRFDAKMKCPRCDSRGQYKSAIEFLKRILKEHAEKNPTKETDFFRRKMWQEFPKMSTVLVDAMLYDAISEHMSREQSQ